MAVVQPKSKSSGATRDLDWAQPLARRDVAKAARVLLAQLKTDDSAIARFNLGIVRLHQGKDAAALKELRKAGRMDPDWIVKPAARLIWLGYMDAGRAAVDGGLKARPDDASLVWARGVYHETRYDLKEALADYEEAVRREVPIDGVERAIGEMHMALGDTDRACEVLEGVVARDPSDHVALYWLGIARTKAGHYKEAMRAIRKSAKIDPKDEPEQVHYRLAICRAQLGENEKALSSLDRALGAGWVSWYAAWNDPLLDPLRDLKGFDAWRRKVKARFFALHAEEGDCTEVIDDPGLDPALIRLVEAAVRRDAPAVEVVARQAVAIARARIAGGADPSRVGDALIFALGQAVKAMTSVVAAHALLPLMADAGIPATARSFQALSAASRRTWEEGRKLSFEDPFRVWVYAERLKEQAAGLLERAKTQRGRKRSDLERTAWALRHTATCARLSLTGSNIFFGDHNRELDPHLADPMTFEAVRGCLARSGPTASKQLEALVSARVGKDPLTVAAVLRHLMHELLAQEKAKPARRAALLAVEMIGFIDGVLNMAWYDFDTPDFLSTLVDVALQHGWRDVARSISKFLEAREGTDREDLVRWLGLSRVKARAFWRLVE